MNSKSNSQAMETEKIPRLSGTACNSCGCRSQHHPPLYNIRQSLSGHFKFWGGATHRRVGLFTPSLC